MDTTRPVLIFAGGEETPPGALEALAADAFVIAADSGLTHALAHGRAVDLVVGDLDSAPPRLVEAASAAGAVVERHPADKDQTDLALALDAAAALGARVVTVVGGHGGRLDHLFANLLLLGAPRYAGLELDAVMGPARVVIVHDRRTLLGEPGELVSLLALHGSAAGVSTEGLLFPLRDAVLAAGASLGVSNEFAAPQAQVTVERGCVAAVAPGVRGVLWQARRQAGQHSE
ncbi:MAG: thiamine diphosphokinase [Acidimicrobiales bacterium]